MFNYYCAAKKSEAMLYNVYVFLFLKHFCCCCCVLSKRWLAMFEGECKFGKSKSLCLFVVVCVCNGHAHG